MLIDINEDLDFGNPSLGKIRDHLVTYEVIDQETGISTVFAGDLVTGNVQNIATLNVEGGIATPSYTGDDKGIVYAQGDDSVLSEFSLFRQEVGGDGISPTGDPTPWLSDGAYGVIYRRGTFDSTNQLPTASITQPSQNEQFTAPATITVAATASDDDGEVTRVEFYQGSELLFNDMEAPFEFTWQDVQTGGYRLLARAFDELGGAADSAPVSITVAGASIAPTITTQPQNQTAVAGETATFSVVATGTEPLTFQWRKNEIAINQATEAMLTLENVQASDEGNYDVVVSNAAGSATSNPATLTVTVEEDPTHPAGI